MIIAADFFMTMGMIFIFLLSSVVGGIIGAGIVKLIEGLFK